MTIRTIRTPIVLLPGWGFTPEVWAPLIAALTAQGIAPELIHTRRLPLESDDLPTILQTLSVGLPPDAHLVGWSLGGELALALANHCPERVTALTLIASTPCFMNREDWVAGQPAALLDDFDQRLADSPTALLKRFSSLLRHGDTHASRDRSLAEALLQANETTYAHLANGLKLLRQLDLRQLALPATLPITLIHGDADAVVPLAAATSLQMQLNGHLLQIAGASHALPLTHAVEIVAAMKARSAHA